MRLIAAAHGLQWKAYSRSSSTVTNVIQQALQHSYVMMMFNVPGTNWAHSVLIYRMRSNDIAFMEPDGRKPHYHVASLSWLQGLTAVALMHM